MVTITRSMAPAADRTGVALTSMVTLRPSGVEARISSPRTVSAPSSTLASGYSARSISVPSARRTVMTSSICSDAAAGRAQPLDDALALLVDRQHVAGRSVEHHDADRRGLDHGLESGPQASGGALRGGIGGDGRCRVRGDL